MDVEGEERVPGSSGSLCMKGTLSNRKSTRATYLLLPPPASTDTLGEFCHKIGGGTKIIASVCLVQVNTVLKIKNKFVFKAADIMPADTGLNTIAQII